MRTAYFYNCVLTHKRHFRAQFGALKQSTGWREVSCGNFNAPALPMEPQSRKFQKKNQNGQKGTENGKSFPTFLGHSNHPQRATSMLLRGYAAQPRCGGRY